MGPDWSGLSHVPIHEPITVIGVKYDEWRRLINVVQSVWAGNREREEEMLAWQQEGWQMDVGLLKITDDILPTFRRFGYLLMVQEGPEAAQRRAGRSRKVAFTLPQTQHHKTSYLAFSRQNGQMGSGAPGGPYGAEAGLQSKFRFLLDLHDRCAYPLKNNLLRFYQLDNLCYRFKDTFRYL